MTAQKQTKIGAIVVTRKLYPGEQLPYFSLSELLLFPHTYCPIVWVVTPKKAKRILKFYATESWKERRKLGWMIATEIKREKKQAKFAPHIDLIIGMRKEGARWTEISKKIKIPPWQISLYYTNELQGGNLGGT